MKITMGQAEGGVKHRAPLWPAGAKVKILFNESCQI